MIVPDLLARVEKRCEYSGQWVWANHPDAFVFVAKRTGKPEIALLRQTAESNRNDMFNLHRRAAQ